MLHMQHIRQTEYKELHSRTIGWLWKCVNVYCT